MKRKKLAIWTTTALVALGSGVLSSGSHAADAAAAAARVSANVMTGVVTSTKGPEAGVWVIAETSDLPTRLIKIVVTDDQGRYLMPELPKAKYKVWVRGYGLVDSPQTDATPGSKLDLKAVIAPSAAAAAAYYPPDYWLSLMNFPAASEFPGTGPKGNGIPPKFKTQQEFISGLKSDCIACHQQGTATTRTLANSSVEGWYERLKAARPLGDAGVGNHGLGLSKTMQNRMTGLGPRGLATFADWTKRIENKDLPPVPPRPQGVERNVVLTIWDFGFGHALHDQITTDKRNPAVNANGWVYAVASTTGRLEYLDPVKNVVGEIQLPALPGKDQLNVFPHNPMIDGKGRVWITDLGQYTLPDRLPAEQKAGFCSDVNNKFGKYYPMTGSNADKQILIFDPATEQTKSVTNCFSVHHLAFEYDKSDTLVFSGDSNVIGWVDTKAWDQTGDAAKSQGWCPMVLDTKEKVRADGNITPDRNAWNQPPEVRGSGEDAVVVGEAGHDPEKDTRIVGFPYGIDINPKDNTAWLYKTAPFPTGIVRFDKGSNPPETCKSEYYEPPKKGNEYLAYAGKSVALDLKGIAYVSFNSGKLGRFDRSKCKVTRGPTATGQQCPEGWSFFDIPGPKMGQTNVTAEHLYLNWLDLYDTFGLGKDIPLAPGSNSDSLIAWMPDTGKALTFRVPYPRGFFGRGMDGRIDDPKAGWKGKGLWGVFASQATGHQEGGDEGKGPEYVHFQLRSSPLEE